MQCNYGIEKTFDCKKYLFPPGIEPGTLRVWGARDNRYTTETTKSPRLLSEVSLGTYNVIMSMVVT